MVTVETIELSGQDETVKVPQAGLSLRLPLLSETSSSMVTIERIAGNKWEAPQHMNKLVTSNTKYIAYTVQVHDKQVMKVVTLDNSSKTVIKGISGLVYDVMFKDVNQDTLAILSMEDGTLNLYVYSILVNMSDKLDHEQVLQHTFSPSDSCRPVLAFQPSDEDTTYLALGINTTLHIITLDDVEETVVTQHSIKHTAPITGMCIAEEDAEDGLIVATCSEDGSVLFYNTSTQNIMMHWKPFNALLPQPPSTEPILWMGFADNHQDPEAQNWRYLVAATQSKVAIINCHDDWTINHYITFVSEDAPLTHNMRYQVDPSGRFLIMTPLTSPFLYIMQLDTEGDCGYFTQLTCYPLARSLYDVTVKRVVSEESVQSRFSDGSIRHNLHLIGVNNQAIQGMNAIFDKGSSPLTELLNTSHTSRGSAASSLKGGAGALSASSSVKGMSAASSVKSLNTSQQDTLLLLGPSAFSSTSATPSADYNTPNEYRLSGDYAPHSVPVSAPFAKPPLSTSDLMPTPLPTPDTMGQTQDTPLFHSEDTISDPVCQSEPTSDGVDICEFRKCEDVDVLRLLNGVFIADCDEASVNELEADLISHLDGLQSVEDEEFSASFIELYQSRSGSNVVSQLFSKYLIIHSYNCPDAIVSINKALRNTSFIQNFNLILCESVGEFLLNCKKEVFNSLQAMVRRLYNSETFLHHNMLVLLEKLVKSHFECESEAWSQTVISNLGMLIEDIRIKDASETQFITNVKNVLEPLQSQLSEALQGLAPTPASPEYTYPDTYQPPDSTYQPPAESTFQPVESIYQPPKTESTYKPEDSASEFARSSSILLGMLKNNSSQLSQELPQPNVNDMLDNAPRVVEYECSSGDDRFESPLGELPVPVSDIESNVESNKSNLGYNSDCSNTSETKSSVQSEGESFPAQDVRYKNIHAKPPQKKQAKPESHKLSSIDDLKKAVSSLKRNNEAIRNIQPPRHRENNNISQTVRDRLSRSNSQSKQISSCVDSFYNLVKMNLDKDIERWFDDVVQMFRSSFKSSFDNKKNKLSFKVEQKELDKSVSKLVNAVRGTVAESITSAMTEQDLRREIQQTILPSFQAMLGQTFKQIEDSVSKEFSNHGNALSQLKRDSRQDEQALLDQLIAIERSIGQLETLQSQRSDLFKQQLVTMEGRLNVAVNDLYQRHSVR